MVYDGQLYAAVALGGLRNEVSVANETKQATHQPLTAICDVMLIFYY